MVYLDKNITQKQVNMRYIQFGYFIMFFGHNLQYSYITVCLSTSQLNKNLKAFPFSMFVRILNICDSYQYSITVT